MSEYDEMREIQRESEELRREREADLRWEHRHDEVRRCPTCKSDRPEYVKARRPSDGTIQTYIWFDRAEAERSRAKHWHCPDPFHNPAMPSCLRCGDTKKVVDHEDDKRVYLRCPDCNPPNRG